MTGAGQGERGALLWFEHSPDMMLVTEGERHRVVAANGSVRALAPAATAEGRPLAEVLERLGVGPEVLGLLDESLARGQPRSWRAQRLEVAGSTDEPIVAFVDLETSPWHDEHGRPAGLVVRARERTAPLDLGSSEATPRRGVGADTSADGPLHDHVSPDELPLIPGLDLAARYVLSGDGMPGGDWFDAVPRPGGATALAVGDVVGHGGAAATASSWLRAVLADRLADRSDLIEVMARLDEFAATTATTAARVCVAVVDPGTGEVEYSTAGLPPPLIVTASGRTRLLEPTGGGPLGFGRLPATARTRLEPGEVLLMYTDGLVDRPGTDLARSTAELAEAAAAVVRSPDAMIPRSTRTPDRVAQLCLEMLVGLSPPRDDIALLVAERVSPLRPFRLQVAARADAPARVRAALAAWMSEIDARAIDRIAVQHAVNELVSNAVQHAYPHERSGEVAVDASVAGDGTMSCAVHDDGRWQGGARDGRGLAMAAGLVDRLRVHREPDGTTAAITHKLSRRAGLMVAPTHGGAGTAERTRLEIVLTADGLRLTGPIDDETAPDLWSALRRASAGGTAPLRLDLREVDHLCSAGIKVLYDALEVNPDLTLVAPSGSAAQQVLELVRLPWEDAGSNSGNGGSRGI